MIYLIDLVVMLAAGLAILGIWLVLRGLSGQERAIDRRMALAASVKSSTAAEPAGGAFDQLLDRRWPKLRRRLVAAGAPFTPARLVLGVAAVGLAVLLGALMLGLSGLAALALAAAAAWALPGVVLSTLANSRRQRLLAQLPQSVELIARSLQAGHPVAMAMSVVGEQMPAPAGPEFKTVLAEMNFGLDRDAALRALAERYPLPELRMFAASLEVTRETGGNVSEVLLKLADDMRATAHLRRKAQAISAEGRLSFWVISALPFVVVAAIMGMQPHYYRDAVGDPLFWPLMSVPPMLWLVGAMTIWRMVNFKV
jgi:tight adherence protein B